MFQASMGCCGNARPVSDLRGLAAIADLYPANTKAGRKARARVALAMLERRALARGDLGMVNRVRRELGTVTPAAREVLAQAGAASLAAARGTRYATDVERVLSGARAAITILQGIISAVGAANPADTGITDAGNTVAWVNWVLGGPLPSIVSDNDVRILKAIFGFTPVLVSAVNAGAALAGPADANVQGAAAWITRNWLPSLKTAVDAAFDALPPLAATAPPATPPGGGFTVGPTTGIRCPEGQVSTAYGCRPPCPPGTFQTRAGCESFSRPIGPDGQPINYVRCPDGTYAQSVERCARTGGSAKTSPVVLALPVAALLWYFLK